MSVIATTIQVELLPIDSPREELEAFIADSGMAIAMRPEEEAGFCVRGFMFDEGTGSSRSFLKGGDFLMKMGGQLRRSPVNALGLSRMGITL